MSSGQTLLELSKYLCFPGFSVIFHSGKSQVVLTSAMEVRPMSTIQSMILAHWGTLLDPVLDILVGFVSSLLAALLLRRLDK